MTSRPNYTDRALVDSACESILNFIKPGDVVNQDLTHKWWEFWYAIAFYSIRRYQKNLFGKDSEWRDVHNMIYFNENNTFSVELPKATLKPLKEYCLTNFSIYRLTLTELTDEYINTMQTAADRMLGEYYDIGQLLDIVINDILGYEHQRRLKIFDFGRNKKVCSVGVRIVFEYLYNEKIRTLESKPGKWLFYELNPEKWSPEKVEEYQGTDVEATSPAHFANSDYFCNEFELIAKFDEGKQIFPE